MMRTWVGSATAASRDAARRTNRRLSWQWKRMKRWSIPCVRCSNRCAALTTRRCRIGRPDDWPRKRKFLPMAWAPFAALPTRVMRIPSSRRRIGVRPLKPRAHVGSMSSEQRQARTRRCLSRDRARQICAALFGRSGLPVQSPFSLA